MTERAMMIIASTKDLVGDLLYYGRKEDKDLPIGGIEAAIAAGEISVDQIVAVFAEELRRKLKP